MRVLKQSQRCFLIVPVSYSRMLQYLTLFNHLLLILRLFYSSIIIIIIIIIGGGGGGVGMSRKTTNVKWTERMNSDILEYKKKSKEMVSSNNPPYYTNGRKKGYIEVTKDLWKERGYGYLKSMSQNLRDQALRLEKILQDPTRNNGNVRLVDRNKGEAESSEGEVFQENSQTVQQNNMSISEEIFSMYHREEPEKPL